MFTAINYKICDNSKDCPAMTECSTGALYWDEETNLLSIDNSLCTTCYNCEEECAVGAIRVARDMSEYEQIKKEIDEDPREISDLMVDRYGAQPILPEFHISVYQFEKQIIQSTKLCIVELFKWDLVECLISSVPIKKLFKGYDYVYRKIDIDDDDDDDDDLLTIQYSIKKLPSLLFFSNGTIIGTIEGFYGLDKEDMLSKEIKTILKANNIFPKYL